MAEQANDATAAPDVPDGIDAAGVEAWFEANAPGAEPPLRFCYVAHAYRSVRPQRGQDRGGDRGVDAQAADPQAAAALSAADQHPAVALVAGCALAAAAVEDAELAAAHPAAGQPLQKGAALPDRASPRRVEHRPHVGVEPLLVGEVGVPVDVAVVVAGDEHRPLGVAGHPFAGPRHAAGVDVAFSAGAPVHIGARIPGMGEDLVDRMVGRRRPLDLPVVAQWQAQTLLTQPQPHAPR